MQWEQFARTRFSLVHSRAGCRQDSLLGLGVEIGSSDQSVTTGFLIGISNKDCDVLGTFKWRFSALCLIHSQDIRKIKSSNAFKRSLKPPSPRTPASKLPFSATRQAHTCNHIVRCRPGHPHSPIGCTPRGSYSARARVSAF